MEQLRRVLKLFAENVGLGFDCNNPRAWSCLPDEYLERLIDLMMASEESPALPSSRTTILFFIAKLGGGVRPIGLIVSILRVLGRLRLPLVRDWMRANNDECVRGTGASRACDRAGWEHNLLVGYAE